MKFKKLNKEHLHLLSKKLKEINHYDNIMTK